MKKEYLILIALILILAAYLLFHKENTDNFTLPEIAKIDISKITGLVIDKKEGSIEFTKKKDLWLITDKEYPADSSLVQSILDTLKSLKLSELVSQKQDLGRYELDDENRIQVKAVAGQKTIFEFTMGKTAPSFNHTFVMLINDKNIYYAKGNFRTHFDKTIENFRDKKVLEFKEDSIKQFTIEKEGISKTLVSKKDKDKKKTAIIWQSDKDTPADEKMVSSLLSSVSFLKCEKYLGSFTKNKLGKEKSLCRIHLKNEKSIELTLFKTETEDNLIGISSMNEYVFALNQYNGKEILSAVDELLGIPKKEKSKD
ncbi:DUF4340 domain-containing protein [Desulfobacula sp.]